MGRKYEIHTREEGSADEIPPLGDFESDHDEEPASAQATAVPDTPVPPAPFPQDVLQVSEVLGMNLEELMGTLPQEWAKQLDAHFRTCIRIIHPDKAPPELRKQARARCQQLLASKGLLAEFLQGWQDIRLNFAQPACHCSRCLAFYRKLRQCRFCLGGDTKNGHTVPKGSRVAVCGLGGTSSSSEHGDVVEDECSDDIDLVVLRHSEYLG